MLFRSLPSRRFFAPRILIVFVYFLGKSCRGHDPKTFGKNFSKALTKGTAADIIKIAMIRVFNRLKSENMKSRLILQVHDELIVEAPKNEAEKAAAILKEEMENAVKLSVPLIADANIGDTWLDAK